MLLDEYTDLEQDRESTTHQVYVLENFKTIEEHAEKSDEFSTTKEDQKNMMFLVKECDQSRNLSPTAPYSYELQQGVESCDDQLDEVTSACATQASSMIQFKSSLGGDGEPNSDGFQTPTKFMDKKVSSTGYKCPPAPRKPKAKPLGKRKRVCNNLQVEFAHEVESVLRLLISRDHPKVKKARPEANA